MKKILIIITLAFFSFSQTINEITEDDVDYFTKFEFWYTSPGVNDSCKVQYLNYKKNVRKNPALAVEFFKNAYSLAQKNDRYNLSNLSLDLYFINKLLKKRTKEDAIEAEKRLVKIGSLESRNTYIKKMRLVKEYLNTELKMVMKRFGIEQIEVAEEYDLNDLKSKFFYSFEFRLGYGNNKFDTQVGRLVNSRDRTFDVKEPSIPFGLGLKIGDDKWRFGFSYDLSLFNTNSVIDGFDVESAGKISLTSITASYILTKNDYSNVYLIGGIDIYSINFEAIHISSEKSTIGGGTRLIKLDANEKTKSSSGFNLGAGYEYYLGMETSLFANFSYHSFSTDLKYTESSHVYYTFGFLYHIY